MKNLSLSAFALVFVSGGALAQTASPMPTTNAAASASNAPSASNAAPATSPTAPAAAFPKAASPEAAPGQEPPPASASPNVAAAPALQPAPVNATTNQTVATAQVAAVSPESSSPNDAEAADSAAESEEVRERKGVYWSARLGGGITTVTTADAAGNEMSISGSGVTIGGGIGAVVAPNLILQIELNAGIASNPEIHYLGQSLTTEDASSAVMGLGPSLTHYFMPANISLAAAVLISSASISQGDTKLGESEMGLGAAFRLGKEWQVGGVGLGVAAQYQVAFLKEKGDDQDVDASSLSLNATVNTN